MPNTRTHQKILQASLLQKLNFVRRTPSVFTAWLLFSLAVGLIGWGVLLANLKEAHSAVETRALHEANALARTHADRLSRSLGSVDLVTRHVRLEWQLSGGQLDLQKLADEGLFPPATLYYVTLIDREGMPIGSTAKNFAPASVRDRDYFIAQRDARTDTLSISPPVAAGQGRLNVLQLARRLTDASGAFAGIVLVSVAQDFFTANYDATVLGTHGLLGMVGNDRAMEVVRIGENLLPPEFGAFSSMPRLDSLSGSTLWPASAFEDRRPRYLG